MTEIPSLGDHVRSLATPDRRRCMVCGAAVRGATTRWTARCPDCGTWVSSLEPDIAHSADFRIDDATRTAGLREIRRQNFSVVLDRIGSVVALDDARLLDVGCAYGWFLAAAAERGARATGVEPDAAIAAVARAEGHEVIEGMFPDATEHLRGQVDVITFNDVLEHIPDAPGALAGAFSLLRAGGVLSINIPTSDGLGYRLSRLLARAGVLGPFRRFWQTDLPSPHIHYFPRQALSALLTAAGFEVVEIAPLAAITRDGLWQRVHTVRDPSPSSVASYLALRLATPILNRPGASDIVHAVAVRPAS